MLTQRLKKNEDLIIRNQLWRIPELITLTIWILKCSKCVPEGIRTPIFGTGNQNSIH